MTKTKNDLDQLFDMMFNMVQKELEQANASGYCSKDLIESVSLMLHIGYERLKNDK